MTLFDGEPLTEAEVASRQVCECGHTRGEHRGGWQCLADDCCCEEFEERQP